jgi:hypothetical protein
MKNLLRIAFTMILVSCTMSYSIGQTLKERIDEAKVVKVYFKNSPIKHNPHTGQDIATGRPGTGCESFGETTPLPTEYTDAVNGIIDLLNKGFNTTAFVAGDYSAVPLRTSGILKGEPDWAALNEPLIVFVYTWGEYSVNRNTEGGKQNTFTMDSYLNIYYLKDGKIKSFDQKALASKRTEPIKTQNCDNYDYFVKNFPANSLVDSFKAAFVENTNELIAKDMKKYEKAMSKKK